MGRAEFAVFVTATLATVACGSEENGRSGGGSSGGGGADSGLPDASSGGTAGDSGGTSATDAGPETGADAGTSCALLIKYGLDIPTPSHVAANVAKVDAMPFDGLVVTLPVQSAAIQRPTPVSAAAIESALAPMKQASLAKVRHNFVRVLATHGGSFDDYTTPAANFRALAAAARDAGLEGIFFDNEEYFPELGPVWGSGACGSSDLTTCQAAARAAGKLVMAEMIAEWPTVTVIVLYGPWVSEPKTFAFFDGYFPYNDVSAANPAMGPFVIGMIEASVGTSARLVDGGELYSIREKAEFERAYEWMKWELPKQGASIPSSLASSYGKTVSVAFGVYDRPFLGMPMSASIWSTTLSNALILADRYAWAYTEEHDWWGVGWPQAGPPPAQWVEATQSAREAAWATCKPD